MRRILMFVIVLMLGAAIIAIKRSASAFSAVANSAKLEPAVLEKELKDADLDFAKQTAARGLEGWMEFFAGDASTISSGKVVSGKEALRKYYEAVFAGKDFSLTWQPTKAEAAKDGTLGYTYGNYEAREGTQVSHGMYVTEWRKINGKWKVVLDLGSSAPAVAKQ